MTAKELIKHIQDICKDDLERRVIFEGHVEVSVNDDWKDHALIFTECSVSSNHPKSVNILIEN